MKRERKRTRRWRKEDSVERRFCQQTIEEATQRILGTENKQQQTVVAQAEWEGRQSSKKS